MILKYSRYTLDYGLHYTSYPAVLKVCSDTNQIFDIKDSKSTNRHVFILDGAVVSCKSSKKMYIARFMIKSKFIALDKTREEVE